VADTYEIRRIGESGTLDEIVAHNAFVHFEVMSSDLGATDWWCGITTPDGKTIHLNFRVMHARKDKDAGLNVSEDN
jgi:hypothetical protein